MHESIFIDRAHSLSAPATLLHGEFLPRGFPPRLGSTELNHTTDCPNKIACAKSLKTTETSQQSYFPPVNKNFCFQLSFLIQCRCVTGEIKII